MVGSTLAGKVLGAYSPRGTSVQHSLHYLRFEKPDFERQSGISSVVQLGTVFPDTRPSSADTTLNLDVKVRTLADIAERLLNISRIRGGMYFKYTDIQYSTVDQLISKTIILYVSVITVPKNVTCHFNLRIT